MTDSLDILRMTQAMARHAAQRQALIARNIAHADTPGFRARDIPDFADVYAANAAPPSAMRATRPGHLSPAALPEPARAAEVARGEESPDGNTVSLEIEMMRAVDALRQHDMALTVYSKSLDLLRASMGRVR